MQDFEQLQNFFMKFPGVGRRQARRFAYFISTQPVQFRKDFVTTIAHSGNRMRECNVSHQHFFTDNEETLSPIERDSSRDNTRLMIVEKDIDVDAIEKSKSYTGKYFVLGTLVPVVKGNDTETRIPELVQLVQNRIQNDKLQEVIIALSINPESEHTRLFIEEKLQPLQEKYNFTISRLGRGLSTGSELEYSDVDTLKAALESRK